MIKCRMNFPLWSQFNNSEINIQNTSFLIVSMTTTVLHFYIVGAACNVMSALKGWFIIVKT